ncbi:MAG: hypothetical protein ACPG8W_13390 [Candidatus Promineifilaceae bacterium]
MNLYFLVEGKTERKLYPQWLNYLTPELTRVNFYDEIQQNSYYLFSGGGYPQLLDKPLQASVEEINENGKYDYLVVVLDADEVDLDERIDEVMARFGEGGLQLQKCKLKMIVQDKCLESWLLGNRVAFVRQPQKAFLRDCVQFYDVGQHDPELMGMPADYPESPSKFHFAYLRAMLSERNVAYSKRTPASVVQASYLKQLEKRAADLPEQLRSFQSLLTFCQEIRQQTMEDN